MGDVLNDKVSFEPHRWYSPEAERVHVPAGLALQLAAETHDIARGAAMLIELFQRDRIENDFEGPGPFLNDHQTGTLMRLAARSLELLADSAQARIASLDAQHPDAPRTAPRAEGG
jgi:hypothetical protein